MVNCNLLWTAKQSNGRKLERMRDDQQEKSLGLYDLLLKAI